MKAVSYTHLDVYKRQAQGMAIHTPSGGSVRCGGGVKNVGKTCARFGEFGFDPWVLGLSDFLFPADTIPGVDTDFKTSIACLT